jgi:hypothetical protein
MVLIVVNMLRAAEEAKLRLPPRYPTSAVPGWVRRGVIDRLPEGDFGGVRGCTSTVRAFYVQVGFFEVRRCRFDRETA